MMATLNLQTSDWISTTVVAPPSTSHGSIFAAYIDQRHYKILTVSFTQLVTAVIIHFESDIENSKKYVFICHASGEQDLICILWGPEASLAFTKAVEHESFVLRSLSYLVHIRTNLYGPMKVCTTGGRVWELKGDVLVATKGAKSADDISRLSFPVGLCRSYALDA